MKRRVVVTGLGAVTPIGNTVEEFWSGIKEGKVGIGEITKFDTTEYKVKIAAEVKDYQAKDEQEKRLQLLENRKTDLLKERESLQESMDSARMQLKKLLEVKDVDTSIKLYYRNLCMPDNDMNLAQTKDTLLQAISYKNLMRNKVLQKKAETIAKEAEISDEKQELDKKIEQLMK